MMELQALIQLVSDYHPGEENSTSHSSLLSAVQQLKAALTDIEKIGEGIRPLVRALVTASVHLPEEWDDILKALRGVLANTGVPWLHRAFLLKTLPRMLLDAPTDRWRQYGDVLCEVLVRSSVPPPGLEEGNAQNTQDEASQHPNPQERRVALTALLSLQEECAAAIVERLVAQLPQALSTCVAIVSSPSAQDGLKKAFEAWLCRPTSSADASCAMEIEKALKEHFQGYGGLKCEQLCAALISSEPLRSLTEIAALQKDLLALVEVDVSHRNIVSNRLSLAFLLTKATEVLNLVYSSEQKCLEKDVEDFTLPLSAIQLLVQLTDTASVTPESLSIQEMRRLSACLLAVKNADAALDASLPLIECTLHFVLRALPCLSTTDGGVRPLLNDLLGVTSTLLPVVEDAVLKIHSAVPLLRDQQHAINTKAVADEVEGSVQTAQTTFRALRVAQTVVQLCRIFRKKIQNDGEKQREGEYPRHNLEELAAAVRGITLSWRREKKKIQRLPVLTNPQSRRVIAHTAGNKKETHHSYKQPRHVDGGGVHPPSRRHRRDTPLL
ncbi:hypothetical protein C3747_25g217 [Trypanosoma cruzi]|nr:hypothetical protein C3747_25g217 [Trypanosoma cruzi]RNC59124.1 hypothetical protein TcCL_ESM03192 [Trypanosoma cruzi]